MKLREANFIRGVTNLETQNNYVYFCDDTGGNLIKLNLRGDKVFFVKAVERTFRQILLPSKSLDYLFCYIYYLRQSGFIVIKEQSFE